MNVCKTISSFVIALVLCTSITSGATVGHVCHNSYECHGCCRTQNGDLVTDQHSFGPFGPVSGTHETGTCSSVLGKLNDICDNNCGCQAGLECYRPVSGVCCPPMKCYNATWVQQQKEYWHKCAQDPSCGLPP